MKKFSNTQWLVAGASLSVLLLVSLFVQSYGHRSQSLRYNLKPYETKLLNSPSSMTASRYLHVQGNIHSTDVFILDQCPELEVVEIEDQHRHVTVPHHGQEEKDLLLEVGSTVDIHVTNVTGSLKFHIFLNWITEHSYERGSGHDHNHHHHSKDHAHAKFLDESLYSATVNTGEELNHVFKAPKTETYVFLFEGERGHTADASFHIERTNYILDDALAVDKSKLSDCSYNECKYPIASKRNKCIAIRSNLMKKSTVLDIDLVVNQYRYFAVFVSFLPLIGALVYIKFFSESSVGSGAVILHTPGYQLVVEPDI